MKKTVVFLLLLAICVSANAAFENVYSGRLPMANFKQFNRIEETVASGNHRYLFTTYSGFGYMSLDGGLSITDFTLWGYKGIVKSLQGKDDDVIFLYGPAPIDIDAGVYKVDGGGTQSFYQSNDELFGMTTVDSYTYLIRGGASSLTAKITILDYYSNLSHTFTQGVDSMVHSDNGDATVIQNPMEKFIFYVQFPSHPVMYYVDIRPSAGKQFNPDVGIFKNVGTDNILTCAVSHNNSAPRMMLTRSDGLFEILSIDPATGSATIPLQITTASYFVETGNEDAVLHTAGPEEDFYLVCSPSRDAVFRYDGASAGWDVASVGDYIDGIYGDPENHYIFVSTSMNDFFVYRGWAFPSTDLIINNDSTTPLDTPVAVHEEDDYYMLCSMWGNVQLSNTPFIGQGVFGTFNAYTPPIHGINEVHSSMSGCMESGGDRFGLLNSDGVTQGTIDKVHDTYDLNFRKTLYAEGAALQKPMLYINGEMWIAEETGIGILPVGADTYSQVIELDPVLGRPAVMIYDDIRDVVMGGYLKNFFAIVASNKNMLCNDPFPNTGVWGPLWRSLVYNTTDQYCYYKTTSAAGGGDICVTSLANYNSPAFSDTFTHSVDVYNMEIFDSGVLAFTDANKVIHFGKMGTNAVFQQIEQASYPAPTSDQGFQLYGGNFMLIYQFNRGDYSVWRFTDIQPPINVGAYPLSHLAIKVQWEDPNGITLYFEIERRLYPAGTWELAGTTASDVLEFIDTGLQPGTEYEYRIFAFSDLGPSNPSTTALAQTGPTGNLDMLPYPNPTSGTITLDGLADSGRLYLYSPDGSCLGDWGTTAESFTFDIRERADTELLSGKYFIIYKASEQAGAEEMLIYYVRPEDFGGSK